jgi:hypothetical protein
MAVESIAPETPNVEAIRNRLAVVMTEAALLKAQLRFCKRLEQERERLRRQGLTPGPKGGATDQN